MKLFMSGKNSLIAMGFLLVSLLAVPNVQAQESERNGQPYFSIMSQVVSADAMAITEPGLIPIGNASGSSQDTEVGWGITGAVGWLYNSNWRFDLELGAKALELGEVGINRVFDTTKGEYNVGTFFLNAGYDFRGESFITPYIDLGVGIGLHEVTYEEIATVTVIPPEQFAVTPAFQAKTGVNLEVAEDMDITLGYRFTTLLEPDFDFIAYDRMDVHQFEIGLKFYIEDMIYD